MMTVTRVIHHAKHDAHIFADVMIRAHGIAGRQPFMASTLHKDPNF